MKKIDRKGFTLVETIIAVAILSVVTVPVIGMFIQTAKMDSKARQIQKATDLAQNMMESIREYTMEEIIDQCQKVSADTNTLSFMTDWCPTYKPTKYVVKEITDDASILESLEDNTILGNLVNNYKDEEVYVKVMGNEIRLAFMGIQYNSSYFDAIVTFKCPDSEFKNDTYYLYDVTVSIYQAYHSTSIKLAKITGAVQNK